MAGRKKSETTKIGLEQLLEQLEQVMETMESSELSLEQSFQLYKKGMDLLLQCNQARSPGAGGLVGNSAARDSPCAYVHLLSNYTYLQN